jgi:hypothetical protein
MCIWKNVLFNATWFSIGGVLQKIKDESNDWIMTGDKQLAEIIN